MCSLHLSLVDNLGANSRLPTSVTFMAHIADSAKQYALFPMSTLVSAIGSRSTNAPLN